MMFVFSMLLQAAQLNSPISPLPPSLHGGPQEMTCPVGGERFSAWQPAMYSTYGARPDGRPYSYLPFPLPVPECPSNRLIVFDKFSEQEIGSLSLLIGTPEYGVWRSRNSPITAGFGWQQSSAGPSRKPWDFFYVQSGKSPPNSCRLPLRPTANLH